MRHWQDIEDDHSFWASLFAGEPPVLMLDYDGTLAPFVEDPAEVRLYPEIRPRLARMLADPGCRTVFVTGRPALDLPRLLAKEFSLPDGLEVFGSHGAEHLAPDGRFNQARLSPDQSLGLAGARDAALAVVPAARLETKPAGLALHWRGLAPEAAERARAALERGWGAIARESALTLHHFDGGLELRPRGSDKGHAVRHILERTRGMVAFLGDDVTDEDAFAAIGERGVGVLVRPEPRPSRARVWLRPPVELGRFLDGWLTRCGGQARGGR